MPTLFYVSKSTKVFWNLLNVGLLIFCNICKLSIFLNVVMIYLGRLISPITNNLFSSVVGVLEDVRQTKTGKSDTSTSLRCSLSPPLLWSPPPLHLHPHLLQWRHTGGELMAVSTNQTSHGAAGVIGSESRSWRSREQEESGGCSCCAGWIQRKEHLGENISVWEAADVKRQHGNTWWRQISQSVK